VLINTTGDVIHYFPSGMILAWSFIDEGFIVTGVQDTSDSTGGITRMLMGVSDIYGNEIIPPVYSVLWSFSEGYARVGVFTDDEPPQRLFGYIDTEGNEIIPPRFYLGGNVSHGLIPVATGNLTRSQWGLIDIHGNEVIPFGKYASIDTFSGGLARVAGTGIERGLFGFINTLGELVIPMRYTRANGFYEGLSAVMTGTTTWDYIEAIFENGEIRYERVTEWDARWGFIDGAGNEILPLEYDEVRNFSNGMAAVAVGAYDGTQTVLTWGFVNTAGEVIVTPKYAWVSDFVDGYAVVNEGGATARTQDTHIENFIIVGEDILMGGVYKIIDRWGREVLTLDYDAVGVLSEGILPVNSGKLYDWTGSDWSLVENGRWGYILLNK
jgi:hypothetical protein